MIIQLLANLIVQAVEKYYEGKNAKLGLDRIIKFDRDFITIDIPVEGVTNEVGWKIMPLSHPAMVSNFNTVPIFMRVRDMCILSHK